uniref:Ionotropic receptor 15 n=1 Tax=Holotrichia parallela TaxID=93412 RepID=A0A2P9JY97_HOLPA|nr:ionotropic receptor 15 [Holotrichia parallela]
MDKTSIKNTLSTIASRLSGTNFLVIVSMELVTYVMETATALRLVDTNNQWLYVISNHKLNNKSVAGILRNLKEGNNIAFLYNVSMSGVDCKEGMKCHIEEMLDAFSKALDAAILDEFELAGQVSDEEWDAIRPTKLERRIFLLDIMKDYLIKNSVCGNCTAWQIKACDTWGKEFKTSSTSEFNLIQVGYWRLANGPSMTDVLFPHVVHGFRGKSFPLISFHNPPWQIIERNKTGGVNWRGLVFDIINELAKSLNFTYTVIVLDNGTNVLENNSNNSNEISYGVTYTVPERVIQMVQNKLVFLAAAAYTITEQSKAMVNFTMPISTQTYSILAARPKELSRALLFMSPFTYSTWLCLLLAIMMMGPILYIVHKYSPVNEYNGINVQGGLSSVYNCIWYIYGALLQQGGLYLPFADSARIIVGAWWLVVLVLSTTYCGNLVAFLTFPNNDKPITTLNDLLSRRHTVTWSITPATFFEYEIKVSNEPKYQILYHGSMKDIKNLEEMIRNIELGKHVHIDWKIRLQYMMKEQFLSKSTCDLSMGKQDFFEERLGIIVAQDNPYLERINLEIKRLHQVGLIEKWLKDYLPKRDRCFKTKGSSGVNNHTVNLDDMQGCFFVLFFGILLFYFLNKKNRN